MKLATSARRESNRPSSEQPKKGILQREKGAQRLASRQDEYNRKETKALSAIIRLPAVVSLVKGEKEIKATKKVSSRLLQKRVGRGN